jgi:uncharacterized membrane protein
MKRGGIGIYLLGIVLVFLMANTYAISAQESGYQIELVELKVYRDGLVHVDSLLTVNDTVPSMSFELLTSSFDNVFVFDENLTVLDYEVDAWNMTIYSFGASRVRVEYDTIALTEKESGVWTLLLQSPYNVTVYLPLDSTIVYLNSIPISMSTENDRIALSLYPFEWEISYTLPIVGPALFKVSDLNTIPSEVKVGEEVTISVVLTNIGDVESSYTIILEINGEGEDTETVTLGAGTSKKVEFKVKKDAGTYNVEINGLTTQFKVKETSLISNYSAYTIIFIVIVTIISYLIIQRRRASRSEEIFKEHPHLRQEDRNVIEFLETSGGKAFESEIRDNFPEIPKTSLWRLIKRLEKMEIVSIKRIGLQNQVILKK